MEDVLKKIKEIIGVNLSVYQEELITRAVANYAFGALIDSDVEKEVMELCSKEEGDEYDNSNF